MLALALLLAAAAPAEGLDFTPDLQIIYRVVACAGSAPLPAHVDAKIVEAHCAKIGKHIASYQKKYADEAKAFITAIRPPNVPKVLVYPFGGGDLLSALTTFPDATEITTMSLEHSGDPRRIAKGLPAATLAKSLENVRRMISGLLLYNDSKTESMQKLQVGEIPGQLAFFAVALAVHGYEPVRLRFFRVEKDGSLHYIDEADLAAVETKNAKLLRRGWVSPDFSEAFSMSEIEFRPIGGGPSRVHRHMGADLSDGFLGKDPSILRHLEAKGRVSTMTKAASYLLWRNEFGLIRKYLLDNMELMISDSTGIPPRFAKEAGFVQETWGKFQKSFLGANDQHNTDFQKLWAQFPDRKLPFRYGYIDGSPGKHFHMMLTRRPGPKAEWPPAKRPFVGPMPELVGPFLYTKDGVPKLWIPRQDGEAPRLDRDDVVLGGQHARLITSRGVAHVWRPLGYDQARAGTVIYLHGYWVNVDQAWDEYRLAEQFHTSGTNALFVVPESPAEDTDEVQWKDMSALLAEVKSLAKLTLPAGPVVAIAHSGAFRTVLAWLSEPTLQHVAILDGMYRGHDELYSWVRDGQHRRRLTLISVDTFDRAERLATRLGNARRIEDVPETGAPQEAEVVSIRSQYDHMGIVTSGKVIPVVLQMTMLPKV